MIPTFRILSLQHLLIKISIFNDRFHSLINPHTNSANKLKNIPGFEGVKSCYSLVSWGSKPETILLGRYESQWTLYGNLRKRHTSPGKYKIGDIIGITPRFIEEGIGRDAFDLVTFWVGLSYFEILTLVGQYSSGISGQVRP